MKRKLCQDLQFVIRSELKKISTKVFSHADLSTLKNHVGNRMLIWVKKSEGTGFSSGWQGYSLGFLLGFALRKSLGAALTALRKPRPSLLFYLD